jgi:PhzF family phenazine biosynthesis protein
MGHRIVQVDAFTDRAFRGNPAAVCVLGDEPTAGDADGEEAWMAALAREMNLSETAFLRPHPDGWALRWFTPLVEVALCGHATLAAAHVLWEERLAPPGPLRFHTKSGVLTAAQSPDGIVLDFPAQPATPTPPPEGLLDALGTDAAVAVARNRSDWLVELASADAVRAIRPDSTRLAALDVRGTMVTAPADDGVHDFISRWFGPRVGVNEDPVTGSAHCCLGPWWGERLRRHELRGFQASDRGGSVGIRLRGDRVDLIGRAVTILRGELTDAGTAAPYAGSHD